MLILENYKSFGRYSLYHGIPISELEVTKVVLANLYPSGKFRIRYRGSRASDKGRTLQQKRQDCIKASASSFAVYFR
jgi:hypothetical protein